MSSLPLDSTTAVRHGARLGNWPIQSVFGLAWLVTRVPVPDSPWVEITVTYLYIVMYSILSISPHG